MKKWRVTVYDGAILALMAVLLIMNPIAFVWLAVSLMVPVVMLLIVSAVMRMIGSI